MDFCVLPFFFFCHYSRFIISKSCLFAEFVCDEEKWKRERVRRGRQGGNGAFDFLFTLGAIETQRCERICDIESVLITKTGIKGD